MTARYARITSEYYHFWHGLAELQVCSVQRFYSGLCEICTRSSSRWKVINVGRGASSWTTCWTGPENRENIFNVRFGYKLLPIGKALIFLPYMFHSFSHKYRNDSCIKFQFWKGQYVLFIHLFISNKCDRTSLLCFCPNVQRYPDRTLY